MNRFVNAGLVIVFTIILMVIVYYAVYKKAGSGNDLKWYYGVGSLAIIPAYGLSLAAYLSMQKNDTIDLPQ